MNSFVQNSSVVVSEIGGQKVAFVESPMDGDVEWGSKKKLQASIKLITLEKI